MPRMISLFLMCLVPQICHIPTLSHKLKGYGSYDSLLNLLLPILKAQAFGR